SEWLSAKTCQPQQLVYESDVVKMERSIYEKELGDQYTKLHPMLQKRYDIRDEKPIIAKGTMYDIVGVPKILYPLCWFVTVFKLVFPEQGKQIPFTIKNKA